MAGAPTGVVEMPDLIIPPEGGGRAWLPPSWGDAPACLQEEEGGIALLTQPGSLTMLTGTHNGC